MQTAIK